MTWRRRTMSANYKVTKRNTYADMHDIITDTMFPDWWYEINFCEWIDNKFVTYNRRPDNDCGLQLTVTHLGIPRAFDNLPFPGSREFDFRTLGGVGNLTPSRGRWGIWPFVHDERREIAGEILCSWPNGWPKMGRRNSGTLLNLSVKFLYPIFIWKRPSGTYSVLFWNDLPQLNA